MMVQTTQNFTWKQLHTNTFYAFSLYLCFSFNLEINVLSYSSFAVSSTALTSSPSLHCLHDEVVEEKASRCGEYLISIHK